MFTSDENPGGSFEGTGAELKTYLKGYKRMGNHVKRYKFAQRYTHGKNVIEYGCGYGAGAVLLNGKFKNYIGIDIDENAISYARNNIEPVCKNTRFFKLQDFLNSSPSAEAEVVICFEVFEHVKDPVSLISSLKKMTKENGTILLSTPNGLSSNGNVALFRSKFHINEYAPAEFHRILKPHGNVSYFGERRRDTLDVRTLLNRAKNIQIKNNSNRVTPVPLGKSRLFEVANKYLNSSFFWKIYPVDPRRENS
ncbi:MAG TPA: class I SAM-dependent methyltransferase, partial [Thermoplasmataceae archaeon]|nr:class I SAM-dependent methyltransferase [Thermoplasmataceae archaeon]